MPNWRLNVQTKSRVKFIFLFVSSENFPTLDKLGLS